MTDAPNNNSEATNLRRSERLGYFSIFASILALWPVSVPLAIASRHYNRRADASSTVPTLAAVASVISVIAFLLIGMIIYAYYSETHRVKHFDNVDPSIIRDLN